MYIARELSDTEWKLFFNGERLKFLGKAGTLGECAELAWADFLKHNTRRINGETVRKPGSRFIFESELIRR